MFKDLVYQEHVKRKKKKEHRKLFFFYSQNVNRYIYVFLGAGEISPVSHWLPIIVLYNSQDAFIYA